MSDNHEVEPEEVEESNRAVIVVAFDNTDYDRFRHILQSCKDVFKDEENVKVAGAVRETAQEIITVLEEAQ